MALTFVGSVGSHLVSQESSHRVCVILLDGDRRKRYDFLFVGCPVLLYSHRLQVTYE